MDLTPLVQKMSRRDVVSSTEAEHLDRLLSPVRRVAARTELVRQGQMPGHSTLLLSGFCGRVTTLADGARQITQLSLAGDFLDLHSFLLAVMDHSVVALTEVTYCTLAHDDLRRLTESEPHLTRLLWLETVVDAAIHRQWIVSKGRRSGQAQLAHVFCELYTRLEAAGLALDHRFDLPLTQIVGQKLIVGVVCQDVLTARLGKPVPDIADTALLCRVLGVRQRQRDRR